MSKILLPGMESGAHTHEPLIKLTGFSDTPERPETDAVDPDARVSLLLDPARIRALPEELREYNCSSCDRRAAGWAFRPTNKGEDPDPIPICSLCWLYLSNWARARVKEIPGFIERYEQTTGAQFHKDGDGRLVDHREGDAVLLQLLRASAVFLRMQQRRGLADGQ